MDWRDVVGSAGRVPVGVGEVRQALLLVRLEHVHAGRRQDPEHHQGQGDRRGAEDRHVQPTHARDEQDCGERGAVHHRGADIRLDEHEQDRDGTESDRLDHSARLADAPRPVGEKAGEEEDEEQLPELRRLEAEEADVEPALRVARDGSRQEHEHHHPGGADEDRLPEAPVVVRVDEERHDQADAADHGVDHLSREEVVGVARDVVRGDPADRPEAEAEQPADRAEQEPVETADRGGEPDVPRRGSAAGLALGC